MNKHKKKNNKVCLQQNTYSHTNRVQYNEECISETENKYWMYLAPVGNKSENIRY